MAVIDEKQRIEKLVEKVKKYEIQKKQLEGIAKDKSKNDKTPSNRCYYGQYGN